MKLENVDFSKDKGAEIALFHIFANMMRIIIDRLNKVPDMNFIAFLDMLGMKLLPPAAASAPITFYLTEGALKSVLIPSKTQIASGDVIFETEKNIYATPSKLTDIYSCDGEDNIFKCPPNVISGETVDKLKTTLSNDVEAYANEITIDNPQGLEENDDLIITDIEDVYKTEYLTISKVIDNKIILSDRLKNDYLEGSSIEKILTFDIFNGKNLQEHILYLGHDNLYDILFNFKNNNPNESELTIFFTILDTIENINPIENLKWEYWDGEKWNDLKHNFQGGYDYRKEILFTFSLDDILLSPYEKDINGINSFWIRCVEEKEQLWLENIENIQTSAELIDYPDICFYNDIPLNIEKDNIFYPFSEKPEIYDTFYIANKNCFSKKNEFIELQFTFKNRGGYKNSDPSFSYRYWNGSKWNVLNVEQDFFSILDAENHNLSFMCPSDIEPTEINGNHNYWIKFQMHNNVYAKVSENKSSVEYNAPSISNITIILKAKKKPIDNILTFNQLEFQNLTVDDGIRGFKSKKNKDKAVYLGFDRKIKGGPISLFFSLEENELSFDNINRFRWEYFSKIGKWTKLDLVDKTFGLNREGTIEFLFPKDFEKRMKFGKDLYWIKALQVKEQPDNKLEDLGTNNGIQSKDPNTVLKKVLLNTTLATNSETIKNEVLGTSDGTKSQKFTLNRSPIISEEVWVNEVNSISQNDINSIKKDKILLFEEFEDIKGNIIEFWVKWESIDNIESSSNHDRHYEIDKFSQLIKFGDGINGLIPPIGNIIKINYSIGGSSEGNLPIESITDLKSSVPSIDKVTNLIESSGGSDRENIEELKERSLNVLKHRNRGVTIDDFEKIVVGQFKDIVKVKCITNMNNDSCISNSYSDYKFNESGLITIFTSPKTDISLRPNLSSYLKKQIEKYLIEHASNILNIKVLDPIYVEINLTATVTTLNIEHVPEILKKANNILEKFLNPINGGHENKGWDFGELPSFNDFYTILDDIYWVDYVKNISMSLKIYEKDEIKSEYEINPENISKFNLCPYMMIYSGEHDITVEKSEDN